MRTLKRLLLIALLLSAILVAAGISDALEIALEPAEGELDVGGEIRILVYAAGAESL